MKEYTFDKVNEKLYKETLDCGIDVYLYPFTKTKNFYCSINVNYGAKYTKYKKGNKVYDIIPGSAHFLEHRIMLIGEDPVISERINTLGSLANAWTGYYATNYNIFGSTNINENISIILDLFYNAKFNEKDIEEEKGIISEEIDMEKDNIGRFLTSRVFKNSFNNSYVINSVIGEHEDINKITAKSLKRIYDDFYIPNNTFIVITGNFIKEEVMDYIKEYYSKLNLKNKELPSRIIEKETDSVRINYEEVKKDVDKTRVRYIIKMKKNVFNIKKDSELMFYLNTILKLNFSSTSELYEKYKNNDLIFNMTSRTTIVDDYLIINIGVISNKPEEFLSEIQKDIHNLSLNEKEFERIKKSVLKTYILCFDNIEDVEYNIVDQLTRQGSIDYDDYEFITNASYDIASNIINKIDTNNTCVIKTVK